MTTKIDKVVRDGMVAVLYSPGFGAGWFTWNREHLQCLYDPDVVAWVEAGKEGPVPNLEAKYGWEYFYDGGADDLIVAWLPEGTQFRIDEYDGSESLVVASEEIWQTA